MSTNAISQKQKILAYYSHSYRAMDKDVNIFFWELFASRDFVFSVDPKSDKFYIPYAERLMRNADCFIAVVTCRQITPLDGKDGQFNATTRAKKYSPFIAFENFLAELAEEPRLVFLEEGLDSSVFGTNDVFSFNRDFLPRYEKQFSKIVRDFSDKVRAYMGYSFHEAKRGERAGILISSINNGYSRPTLLAIHQILRQEGYSTEEISPNIKNVQDFNRSISRLDLIVAETRVPFITPESIAFAQAKAIPTIYIAKLSPQDINPVIPKILNNYEFEDVKPVIQWRVRDELRTNLLLYLNKFRQRRMILDNAEKGRRYFRSSEIYSGHKVFVSNAHSLNECALDLVERFNAQGINSFQYHVSMPAGAEWKRMLDEQLRECTVFVALINKDYTESKWCRYEMGAAFRLWNSSNKEFPLLPYLLEDAEPPELIIDFINCAPINGNNRENFLEKIVLDVKNKMGKSPVSFGDFSEDFSADLT